MGVRPYNAAGGAFGAPGDIRSADPRFTLSRAPAFANRPASLIARSDDALASSFYSVVAPASFLLNLGAPIIGAKAVGVKQAVIRNLIPTVPDYQRWFFYRIVGPTVDQMYVFKYLYNTAQPLPICLTNDEFVTYINASTPFAVPVPAGTKVTEAWYAAQIAAANVAPVASRPIFAVNVDSGKMGIELPALGAPLAPFNAADKLVLPGINAVQAYVDDSLVAITNGVRRYDLTLNAIIGQPSETADWPYTAPRSPGAALQLPIFIDINGSQTVYVTSNITSNGAQTVSSVARSIIANISVDREPGGRIVYMPQVIHWIWSVSSEGIAQVTIDLLDENLQPIVLPFNVVVEIELAFLYEDSTL